MAAKSDAVAIDIGFILCRTRIVPHRVPFDRTDDRDGLRARPIKAGWELLRGSYEVECPLYEASSQDTLRAHMAQADRAKSSG